MAIGPGRCFVGVGAVACREAEMQRVVRAPWVGAVPGRLAAAGRRTRSGALLCCSPQAVPRAGGLPAGDASLKAHSEMRRRGPSGRRSILLSASAHLSAGESQMRACCQVALVCDANMGGSNYPTARWPLREGGGRRAGALGAAWAAIRTSDHAPSCPSRRLPDSGLGCRLQCGHSESDSQGKGGRQIC